jgi:hypothetical protein
MCYIKIQKKSSKFHLCLELTMTENNEVSVQLVTVPVHNCYKRSPFLWTGTIVTDSSHCCNNHSKWKYSKKCDVRYL